MVLEKFRVSAQKLKISDSKLTRKRKVLSYYDEGETLVEFVSAVEEHYYQIFYQIIDLVVNCICDGFQWKNHTETFQIMERPLLRFLALTLRI